jgi:DNA polymerase-1
MTVEQAAAVLSMPAVTLRRTLERNARPLASGGTSVVCQIEVKVGDEWIVDALQIPTLAPASFQPQTWEADAAAATAVRLARMAGLSVLLLSRDKDWRQNVTDEDPPVRWWSQLDRKLLDRAGFITEHGVPPELLGAWLALVGDASDNVPGVEGIGPAAATVLLPTWPGVDKLLAERPPC